VLTALSRRRRDDGGFSLVEVLVALTLFGLIGAALLPLLVLSGSAAVSARSHTRAKNLAQERVEVMRQLPFQVDVQNGPFVDLLDYYFPSRTAATGTGTGWVPATASAAARLAGEPTTGSFYRTRFDSLPGQPGFRQVVAVQFLDLARTPIADARYASYRHDVAGQDGAPSTLLGVTVLTFWRHAGRERSFRTFTQIGDPGSAQPLLSSSASATLVRLESALSADVAVSSDVLSVTADGRLSDGSSAGVRAVAGRGTTTDAPDVLAASGESLDPSTCTTTDCAQPGSVTGSAVGTCSDTVSYGRSRLQGLTSTAGGGRPRVPANVADVPAARASASLLRENGSACAAMTFDTRNGTADPRLRLSTTQPLALVTGDGTTSGSTPVATSEVYIDATAETAATRYVRAGASTRLVDRSIRLFPTTFAPNGVLRVTLSASQITCTAGGATTGSYTIRVEYWNNGVYRDLTGTSAITWSSASSTTSPYATVNMATRVVDASLGLTLADYVPDPPTLATALKSGATNGVSSIGDAVLSFTTAPVRVVDPTAATLVKDPTSAIGVKVGLLSCVAVDER
jgi:prepilin-type N-terminal cleavage/methylation domain-containing protein